jgi:hypothetical protein
MSQVTKRTLWSREKIAPPSKISSSIRWRSSSLSSEPAGAEVHLEDQRAAGRDHEGLGAWALSDRRDQPFRDGRSFAARR